MAQYLKTEAGYKSVDEALNVETEGRVARHLGALDSTSLSGTSSIGSSSVYSLYVTPITAYPSIEAGDTFIIHFGTSGKAIVHVLDNVYHGICMANSGNGVYALSGSIYGTSITVTRLA